METQEAEFTLPISLFRSMNDLPKELEPVKDHPNIYTYFDNGQQYYLKTYPDEGELYQNLLKVTQFFNEAAIQSSIPHPNILHIDGIILTDNNKFKPGIITKACQYDLRIFLDKNSQENQVLNPTYKTFFALAIIDAISTLHSLNLMHGDIKPDNIFIESDENILFLPLLADFGSSRYIDTNVNIFSGTKFYRAPETMRNESELISKPSDIFSFGMTLLNMAKDASEISSVFGLSSDMNTDNDTILNAYKKIPEILMSENDDDPINDIIIQCCKTEPDDRPTASKLFEEIKNGNFFKGCDKAALNDLLDFDEYLKEKMNDEMDVSNIIHKFATLAESKMLVDEYKIDTKQFGRIMSVLLDFGNSEDYEKLDETSKKLIEDFNSRKVKNTGVAILEIVYNLCKNMPRTSPELIQFFISTEDKTLSAQSKLTEFNPKMIFLSNGINDQKSIPKVIRVANSDQFGSITIKMYQYDRVNKFLSYHITTVKQVKYKVIKIRPSQNKITFKV